MFTEDILKPELQDADSFADGILHIAEAQQRVAQLYMEDGGYELACPPLKAVLSLMARGHYEGMKIDDPELRKLFTRDHLIASDWYRERLEAKQRVDVLHWNTVVEHLRQYKARVGDHEFADELDLNSRLEFAEQRYKEVQDAGYLESLLGTAGVEPLGR